MNYGACLASSSAARVCQPLPDARQRSSVPESMRKVVGRLVVACTLPAGRPRRAARVSGVCTSANSPRFACSSDSRSRGSSIPESALMALTALSISMSSILISRLSDGLRRYVRFLCFCINCNQQHHLVSTQIEVNHAHPTALALAGNSPAYSVPFVHRQTPKIKGSDPFSPLGIQTP